MKPIVNDYFKKFLKDFMYYTNYILKWNDQFLWEIDHIEFDLLVLILIADFVEINHNNVLDHNECNAIC